MSSTSDSNSARLLFICGERSGAGKSCVAMGLLNMFLKSGYSASELGYIKPCTQCEDVQLVSKFCEEHAIKHVPIGPVVFYPGFTKEVIDGTAESTEKRHKRIQTAVTKLAENRKWVIVDGVGYAAVGSIAGVSNAQVASLLNAPVLIVGRGGLGNAIDNLNYMITYFASFQCSVLGVCWNRIPPLESYHTFDDVKKYVTKYVENSLPTISPYGHIPVVEETKKKETEEPNNGTSTMCILRAAKTDLQYTEEEKSFVTQFLTTFENSFNFQKLLTDLENHYKSSKSTISKQDASSTSS